jgi:hypothetical protein
VSSNRGGRNTQRGVAADPRNEAAPARDYEPRPSDLGGGGGGDMDDLPF